MESLNAGVSDYCYGSCEVDEEYCLFLFTGLCRHDIISNEIRTNMTINFLRNILMCEAGCGREVNLIHVITLTVTSSFPYSSVCL